MCLDIIRDPVKSLLQAKKRKTMNKTFLTVIEECVLFAIAGGLVVAKLGLGSAGVFASAVAVFLFALIFVLLFSLMVHISAVTLGGKGKFYEGLTAVAYSTLPEAVGLFAVSLLALVPFTVGVQIIVLALSFALGLSMLYRGIKELYSIDTVTSFVVVSVVIVVLILALYISAGISLLGNLPIRALV